MMPMMMKYVMRQIIVLTKLIQISKTVMAMLREMCATLMMIMMELMIHLTQMTVMPISVVMLMLMVL